MVINYKMFDTADATAEQVSSITNIDMVDKATINIKFSAANSGTLLVEVRNGRDRSPLDLDSDWIALNFGATLSVTSETDVQLFMRELCFNEMRLTWTPSSGSGTITATLNSKSLGA